MAKRKPDKNCRTVKERKVTPQTVQVQLRHDEAPDRTLARTLLSPALRAAHTIDAFQRVTGQGPSMMGLIAELTDQIQAVECSNLSRAEGMLIAQAHTLDAIFASLAHRAAVQEYLPQYEAHMRLALKAQAQCARTLEVLGTLKNPAPVAFVQQANIAAGHQQVNNGVSAQDAPRAEKNASAPSKLLEVIHGERLDGTASGAPSCAHPELEAVGTIDRPKVGRR